MIFVCSDKDELYVIENHLWKESEYRQYSIIDFKNRKSILSCSLCHLQTIIAEKKVLGYDIIEIKE